MSHQIFKWLKSWSEMKLTNFGGRVDVFYGEHSSESEEQNFGKSRHQLGRGDKNVDTIGSVQKQKISLRNRKILIVYRELMREMHLMAKVSQFSVTASISALNCSQCSLLAGPNNPVRKSGF
jgi:hypothetical protein